MNEAFLALGGNLGDRTANLQLAIHELKSHSILIRQQSSIYETEPWGMNSTAHFLNQCISIKTTLNAQELLSVCLDTEKKMGRQRKSNQYESRIIDIDILLFNQEIINEKDFEIPHPRLHLRKFVLVPLAEIRPKFQHPVFKKSIQELLNECKDAGAVTKIE
jgi:2-amino-4-hydroxy-6-hydroxymethyldihydropteridine diphosphokinase